MGHVLWFCPEPAYHRRGMLEVRVSSFLVQYVTNGPSSYRWVTQRKAFGKPLSSQAVVRSKLAAMIARVESVQNWLENLTFQMTNMVSLRPQSTRFPQII